MYSYWEQQSFTRYDHIIVGAGIVGLSVAAELKERYPEARILVLERALLPTGASTRNAGFACMGSVTELLDDLEHMSEDEVVHLFEWRKQGLEKLRSRLGDDKIGYAANGSYELIGKGEIDALDKVDYLNQLLQPVLQQPAYKIASEKIETFGFARQHVQDMIENTCEGELNTGKMMRALLELVSCMGVEIRTGAEVVRFEEEELYVSVVVKDPFRQDEWLLHGGTVSICTNAFTQQLLPGEEISPGRGQVLITQPIPGLKFKGVFHFDKGYYYFREVNGRVLLGGGRNLDFEGENTTEFGLTEEIQLSLEQKLHEVILPGSNYLIEQRWAGIMAFGPTKQPVVKAFSGRVYGAFRLGGMGVALASKVAMELVNKITPPINL